MSSSPVLDIVCAHSPDSDDAFMFYALATKKVRSRILNVQHVLEDIESLNRKAQEGRYELTAISYHAYPYVADKYVLMASGSSVGDGYGPMVVSTKSTMTPEDLKGKRIAIPGTMTTAFLTLKLFEPDFIPVVVKFDHIIQAVRDREVDAGLIIHEGQLTYGHGGLACVVDLGRWFKQKYDLPLPLGANALRRDLSPEVQAECTRLMREGIQYSLRASRRSFKLCDAVCTRPGSGVGRSVRGYVRKSPHSGWRRHRAAGRPKAAWIWGSKQV